MDLSQLSDEDLHAAASGDMSKVSDQGLQHLSTQHEAAQTPQNQIEKTKAYVGPMDIGGSLENLAGAQLIGPAKSALGRIGQTAAASGARGFGDTEGSIGEKAAHGGLSALIGGAASGLGEGIAKGGNKLADYLMQKAVGMRKNIPGVGNRLTDQGLIGTKSMLASQVENKLPGAEEEVQRVVSGMQDKAPGSEMVNAVSGKGTKFINPDTGLPFEGKETSYNQVKDLANKLSQTQEYSPKALLGLKRASDYEGYTASGTPATSLKAELEQAQADKARELLSTMSGGKSANALADEQALILANKALTKPETIHQGMGSTAFFGKYPGQSLFGSTAAQAAQNVAAPAAKGLVDPRILPALIGEPQRK